jgi:hypothetical protein
MILYLFSIVHESVNVAVSGYFKVDLWTVRVGSFYWNVRNFQTQLHRFWQEHSKFLPSVLQLWFFGLSGVITEKILHLHSSFLSWVLLSGAPQRLLPLQLTSAFAKFWGNIRNYLKYMTNLALGILSWTSANHDGCGKINKHLWVA